MMENDIIIYNTEDGKAKINLQYADGTVWLSQLEIAELFQTTKQNVSKHVKAIFLEGELEESATVNYKLTVQKEGNRKISRQLAYYNLDMILAIGYRVRSIRGIQFRNYASSILKEYLIKGFAMDDERLKNLGGGNYFKELLDRIRDIRSSEKVFYRQVLDLFATSIDYDAKNEEAKKFFATVQNKMHFAIHHHTASELIYSRVDGDKDFMGLSTFKGELPTLKEAKVAKNYLSTEELKSLNALVSGYLDFAERQAQREVKMTMKDWREHVDRILSATGEDLLIGNGRVSRDMMVDKVNQEYKKYSAKTLSQVERDYLTEIKNIESIAEKAGKNSE
jgi:putative DNA-binding protein